MATLIAVYNSDGCVGRCDAKCYDATSDASQCDCICGGKNHGAGKSQALENTKEMASKWIDDYRAAKGITGGHNEVTADTVQGNLF